MKKRICLFVVYVLSLTAYGVLTANPEFTSELNGTKKIIWITGLFLFYLVLALITNKVMSSIGCITMKLANPNTYNPESAKNTGLNYMMILYYVHIIVLYLNQYSNNIRYLNLFNLLGAAIIVVISIIKFQNINLIKRFLIALPFVIYVIIDTFTLGTNI